MAAHDCAVSILRQMAPKLSHCWRLEGTRPRIASVNFCRSSSAATPWPSHANTRSADALPKPQRIGMACKMLMHDSLMNSRKTGIHLPTERRRAPNCKTKTWSKADQQSKAEKTRPNLKPDHAPGNLARTRKLVSAALRVWELKQGIGE